MSSQLSLPLPLLLLFDLTKEVLHFILYAAVDLLNTGQCSLALSVSAPVKTAVLVMGAILMLKPLHVRSKFLVAKL